MNPVNPFRRGSTAPASDHPIPPPEDPNPGEENAEDRTPEAELLAAARGDEAAFGRFYDVTSAAVYGIVLRVIRDPAMAQEVTQEVFVELWRLAPRFDGHKGSARGWATMMAHRRAVDKVRSEQARRNREDADSLGAVAPFDQVSEAVEDSFAYENVRVALEALRPKQREAVVLAYYEGHTYREVAAILGVPEGTIKTRIRDGLRTLRDALGVDV